MKINRAIATALCALLFVHWLTAQRDTSYMLQEVLIMGRDSLNIEQRIQSILPLERASADVRIYLRSQAPGMLQTLALRGNAPHQVPVIWNGLNIRSPMNGTFDLSLLPLSAFTPQVVEGIPSLRALQGNNRALSINVTDSPTGPQIEASTHFNSIANASQQLKASFQWQQWQSDYFFEKQFGRNQFSFPDRTRPGQPRTTLQDGQFEIMHLGSSQCWQLSPHSKLQWQIWYTQTERNIPPSLTESNGSSLQRDTSLRQSLQYSLQSGNFTLKANTALSLDYLQFEQFFHSSQQWLNSIEVTHPIHKNINAGLQAQWELQNARSAQLIGASGRSLADWNGFISGSGSTINWHAFIKMQAMDGRRSPLIWTIQGDYAVKHNSSLQLRAGRSYQFPTLNDLFWLGSGNPELLPESAHFAGLQIKWGEVGKSPFYSVMDAEWKNIDNYILWVPQSGAVWRPQNIKAVSIWSILWRLGYTQKWTKLQWQQEIEWHYLSAVNTRAYHPAQERNIGKQLIYIPPWKAAYSSTWRFRKWTSRLEWQFHSHRYITADNSIELPAFQLFHVEISRYWQWHQNLIYSKLRLENITNQYYEQLAFRPMPGRVLQAQITYHFK